MDHKKLWKILKEMGIPDHLKCLLRTCTQVKKQQLELDVEQWTGSEYRKEYVKAVFCHPAHLTYMQSTSWQNAGLDEAQTEIKISGRNINNLMNANNSHIMGEREEELKSLLLR